MFKKLFIILSIVLSISNLYSQSIRDPKIISLSPYVTEILFKLGYSDNLIAVTSYCNRPKFAKKKPSIGGIINPNYEAILNFNPDIIIATKEDQSKDVVFKLQDLGFYVVVLDEAINFQDIRTNFLKIARIVNKYEFAKFEIDRIINKLEAIKFNEKIDAFIILEKDPLMTVSQDSYLNDILDFAGFRNIVDIKYPRYPIWSREKLLSSHPSFILNFTDEDFVEDVDIFMRANPYAFLEAVEELVEIRKKYDKI